MCQEQEVYLQPKLSRLMVIATINTNHGVRLHKRLFKGARMGFQNGNFQFIGRYSNGPFNFNVSKMVLAHH